MSITLNLKSPSDYFLLLLLNKDSRIDCVLIFFFLYFQTDGLTDMNAIKSVVAKLETELHEKSTNVSFLEAEIRTLQRKLQMKDAEIAKQERELHKLRVSKDSFQVLFFCLLN